jgi:hypothetical protein
MTDLLWGFAAAGLITTTTVQAQVTRIVIDSVVSPAFGGMSYGPAGQYETVAGRAFAIVGLRRP